MSEGTILNIDEACKFLKISKQSLYKHLKTGKIPAMRMGKAWKFHKTLLDEWLIREMREVSQNRANKNAQKELDLFEKK